jgi:hypothetical protein
MEKKQQEDTTKEEEKKKVFCNSFMWIETSNRSTVDKPNSKALNPSKGEFFHCVKDNIANLRSHVFPISI